MPFLYPVAFSGNQWLGMGYEASCSRPLLPSFTRWRVYLEVTMKKIALAAALSLAATSAFAGGLAQPVVEAPVVAAATSSSSGVLIPLLLLVIIAAAASK